VGIGTTTPGTKLQVAGTASFGRTYRNVLAIGPLDTSPAYVTIHTKIPFDVNNAPRLRIRGYNYGNVNRSVDLTLGWYQWQGAFLFAQYQSAVGAYNPSSIRLGTYNDAGTTRVRIELANDGTYWTSFFIDADDVVGQPSDYSGWSYALGTLPADTATITAATQYAGVVYSNAGNVGIGTASPSKKLEVNGDILLNGPATPAVQINSSFGSGRFGQDSAGTFLASDTNGAVLRLLTNNGSLNESLRLTAAGTVGIGTTAPATQLDVRNSQFQQFRLQNTLSSQQLWSGVVADTVGSFIGGNAYYSSSYQFIPNTTAASGLNLRQDGSIELWADTGLTAGTAYVPSKRLVITNTGNVGIGTVTPGALLDVNADALINGLAAGRGAGGVLSNAAFGYHALRVNTTGSDNAAFGASALSANTTGIYNTALGSSAMGSNTTGNDNTAVGVNALALNTSGSNNVAFGVNALLSVTTSSHGVAIGVNTLRSATTGDANVAIGTNALYDVSTGAGNTALGENTGRGITTGSNNTILGGNVTGLAAGLSNNIIIADGAGNRRINVDASGNVGIGTNSPSALLEVNGTGTLAVIRAYATTGVPSLKLESSSGLPYLQFQSGSIVQDTGGGNLRLRAATGGILVFDTNGANERMRIDSAGNLGLGTSAPTQALHVAGNARITGALYDSANSPGTAGQVLTSTATGTAWQNAATALGGTLFAQGGNSFGATATLGTNDAFNLVFRTNSVERMRLDTSGNLGLGSTSPSTKLHLAGAPATFDSVKAQLVLENNTTAYNASPVSGLAFVNLYTSGGASTTMGGITVGREATVSGDTSAYMAFHVKDNNNNLFERMRIDWGGGVAINTTGAGGYMLYVNGTAAAISYTTLSDARYKRDVAPLQMALSRVGQLRGVSYRWRRDQFPNQAFDDRTQIGFIAQELEQVLPELVNTGVDGFKSVAYTGVIPLVVEAVKELHAQIGPLLPLAQVADKLQLSKDTLTLEIKAPVKIAGDLLVAGDVTAVSMKVKKLVADEVQAGKVQAGSVQAARLNSGELALVLDGGAQQDLVDLPVQSSFTVVVSGPDGSFVHATVLNTGGLIQITAKHFSGLDLVAAGNRLRVVNTSVQTKRLTANWMRMG
jgi:hypothetical protein